MDNLLLIRANDPLYGDISLSQDLYDGIKQIINTLSKVSTAQSAVLWGSARRHSSFPSINWF